MPLILLLVAAVLGEALIRVYIRARGWTPNCYAASLDLFQPHPQRGAELKPEFRLRSGVFRISTNSRGLRGPGISTDKPPDVQRVAILGGSSVFGYLVSDGEEAARRLEEKLARRGRRVQVINGGVPGYNLYQTRSRFEELIRPLQPDVVVLYLGWNDLAYVVSERPHHPRFRRRPVASSGERLLGNSALYGFVAYRLLRSRESGTVSEIPQSSPTPAGRAQFRANLDALAGCIEQCGATMVVCSQCTAAHPQADPAVHRFISENPQTLERTQKLASLLQEILKSFAADHDAPFIDAYNLLPADERTLADYVHLTAEGEDRLAELLAVRLDPLLKATP